MGPWGRDGATMAKWTLVIHGGASTSLINRESQPPKPAGGPTSSGIVRSPATANERGQKMEASLRAGADVLAAGGSALDAVEAAVISMEDDEAFNCGRGSVFTAAGTQEMDASVMTGDLACGAVSGLSRTRNPIRAARYVMESTPHVFFGGEGADAIAVEAGLPQEDPAYFRVQSRLDALRKAQAKQVMEISEGGTVKAAKVAAHFSEAGAVEKYKGPNGTVGAVAVDADGNMAAATSTGGMTNKMTGRIGDTAVVGAGTYANNGTVALSSTGHGELFIAHAVGATISAYIESGMGFTEAVNRVVHEKLPEGSGGVVAVSPSGE